jgi:hypothetical protein
MSDNDGKYSKVEREILEILDDMDSRQPERRPANIVDFRRPARRRIPRLRLPELGQWRYAVTPAKLLVLMLVAILGAVFLQGVPFVSPVLIVIAIAAFIAVFFVRSRPSAGPYSSSPKTKRWRGRDIDLSKRR